MAREGGDITYRDMIENEPFNSPIKEFYNGSKIFITGGTGFMGKILIEKLLRTCPDVEKIYLLARPKKGKEISSRFDEQFADPLYDKLRKLQPNFRAKLEYLPGDVGELKLGLSDEDYEKLTNEVNIIFHMAATVRFDERLRTAVRINVRGTREVILMARQVSNLKGMLYVSTAFSNCIHTHVEEKFYDPPILAENLINLVEAVDETILDNMTKTLIGKFPNTYAYTKMVAENAIKEMSKDLPIAVIRPSIIIATAKEPIQGWIDNIYGATGIVVGAGLGILRTLYCDPEGLAEIIPVDYVINAGLVITYDIAKKHERPNKEKLTFNDNDAKEHSNHNVPIYNYVSCNRRPIYWKEFQKNLEVHGIEVPTIFSVWVYSFKLNKNYFMHMMYVIFLHMLPAYIVDGIAFCLKKERKLVKGYKKIHKFSDVLAYFTMRNWTFETKNTEKLFSALTKDDKDDFDFDIANLNWDDYFYTYIRGIRVYLIKDSLETVDQAKRKYRLMQFGHFLICTSTIVGIFKLIWFVMKFIM